MQLPPSHTFLITGRQYLTRHSHGRTTKKFIIPFLNIHCAVQHSVSKITFRESEKQAGVRDWISHDDISDLISIRWTTAQERCCDIHSQWRYNTRRVALAKCSSTRGENKMLLLLELVRSSCHTCMVVSPAQWPVLEAAYFHKLHCQHKLQSIYKHNAKSN